LDYNYKLNIIIFWINEIVQKYCKNHS